MSRVPPGPPDHPRRKSRARNLVPAQREAYRYRESLLYDCWICGWETWTRYAHGIIPIYIVCPMCGGMGGREGSVTRHASGQPLEPGDFYWVGDTLMGPVPEWSP